MRGIHGDDATERRAVIGVEEEPAVSRFDERIGGPSTR